MRAEIRRLQRRLGVTSLYVTHDQVEAMTLGDRLLVLHQGRPAQLATPHGGVRAPRRHLRRRLHRRAGDELPARHAGAGTAAPRSSPPARCCRSPTDAAQAPDGARADHRHPAGAPGARRRRPDAGGRPDRAARVRDAGPRPPRRAPGRAHGGEAVRRTPRRASACRWLCRRSTCTCSTRPPASGSIRSGAENPPVRLAAAQSAD